MPRLVPLALALLTAGCGGAAAKVDLPLSWSFADGRRCADTGATTIAATVDGAALGPPGGYACTDGEMGRMVTLAQVPSDAARVVLVAATASGGALYRGDAPIEPPLPSPIAVVLYFTGGQ